MLSISSFHLVQCRKDQHAELDRSEPGRLFRVSWEALEGEDFSTAFLHNCHDGQD